MHKIYPLIERTDFPHIERNDLNILQVNLGYKCNQRCLHCHVNAGPNRKEMMDLKTINEVIKFSLDNNIRIIDLTGGAPEMNKHFKYIVQTCKENNIHIIDRCNLTIIESEGMTDLPKFLAKHKIEIIASLPCYIEENVNSQRGEGVFKQSIEALKKLNSLGYGKDEELILNLVYNPQGPELPPEQSKLEVDYKNFLSQKYKVFFNKLYTITNMPISRFGSTLVSKKIFHDYMSLLKNSFSSLALKQVMCRELISIDYNGYVYDCDFNQMLDMPLSGKRTHISEVNMKSLKGKKIATADHCYGCTAGTGSSCSGSLIQ